jgi:DDE family transposase
MGRARMRSKASGQTEHLYGETRYAAGKWTRKQRVIIKAEVVRHPGRDPKNNLRFVVTNLPDAPEVVYQIYCGRGDMENRLKDLQQGLAMDRTSCHRFLANQFRVLLTVAAYILFQTLQAQAQGTACAGPQVSTLRERLVKARRVGRTLGAAHRAAPPDQWRLAHDLAADRAPYRCSTRVSPPTSSRRLAPGRGLSPRSRESES